ncbi:MAG: 50S ribosomal protein L25/general stress protein Ctc [Rickettsiales bacterium]|jgi:large subunit ribosomal protein L25|nr:50S ribosomal protein L25/general stress protein Ctc [Rickettsiales bacterium]
MVNKVDLEVSLRTSVGKGASRASRRNGIIPAVIYGANKPAVAIELNPKALIAQTKIKGFKTRQFVLKITGGAEELTLCQNIQYHKVKDTPLHVDFLRIDPKKEMTLNIPVEIIGTEICKGIKNGGLLNLVERHIELICFPTNIPSSIIIDITEMNIDDSITMKDIKLPEGTRFAAKISDEFNPTVVTINPPQEEEVIATDAPVSAEVPSAKGKDEPTKADDAKKDDAKKDKK